MQSFPTRALYDLAFIRLVLFALYPHMCLYLYTK